MVGGARISGSALFLGTRRPRLGFGARDPATTANVRQAAWRQNEYYCRGLCNKSKRMSKANSIAWKRRLGRLWALIQARDAQRRLVLLYHAVGDGPWAIRRHCFEEQIALMQEAAAVLPLKQLMVGAPPAGVALAITFDDGYACLKDNALPVLAGFGFTASVFLNSGEVEDV